MNKGFPTGVGEGELQSIHGGGGREHGGLKMLPKNTCEGVHLMVKLPVIILQAWKFTKDELHTHFQGF